MSWFQMLRGHLKELVTDKEAKILNAPTPRTESWALNHQVKPTALQVTS